MLEVKIKKQLDSFQLDVEFTVTDDIMALLGASGCGKSMTLKCIAGIERPDEGRIVLNDRVLFDSEKKIDLPPQKRRVGYLFQQYALFPTMTVYDNIACGIRPERKLSKQEKDVVIRDIMEKMGISDLAEKKPGFISGGQQQRVALARIMVNEPEVILLDEPFSALDEYLRFKVELEITQLLRQFGRPAVFVSHSRDEVYRVCREVCVLSAGRSARKATVDMLFAEPDTLSACLLSGCKNYSGIQRIGECSVRALDWGVVLQTSRDATQSDAYIGVRSHYLKLAQQEGSNCFPCRVERLIEDVFSGILILSTPGGDVGYSQIRIDTTKEIMSGLQEGQKILVYAAPEDIMLLKE